MDTDPWNALHGGYENGLGLVLQEVLGVLIIERQKKKNDVAIDLYHLLMRAGRFRCSLPHQSSLFSILGFRLGC